MTACPIRYQRQVPDRKGKIFYTSITSLSHISKVGGFVIEKIIRRQKSSPHQWVRILLRKTRRIYEKEHFH